MEPTRSLEFCRRLPDGVATKRVAHAHWNAPIGQVVVVVVVQLAVDLRDWRESGGTCLSVPLGSAGWESWLKIT